MKKFLVLILYATFSMFHLFAQITIPMEQKGGVFYIQGKVNGLPLKFVFDTGASHVYISLTEAIFMLKNGYLSPNDFGGSSFSQIANGQIVENIEVLLKEIVIGGVRITNIKAMISNSIESPLLLGQSAIQKLGPIKLNGNLLIINHNQDYLSTRDIPKLGNYAYQAAEAGNYAEAIAISEYALTLTSDSKTRAWLWGNIGYAYTSSGDNPKAIEAYNRALGEDPMSGDAYNLGVCLFREKKIPEALRTFNSFIQKHPQPNELLIAAYEYKGLCHKDLGENLSAEDALKRSIAMRSSLPRLSSGSAPASFFALAELYKQSNKLSEACKLYKAALQYEPDRLSNIEHWFDYGMCLLNLQQPEKALGALKNSMHAFQTNSGLITVALRFGDNELKKDAAHLFAILANTKLWIARLLLSTDRRAGIKEYEDIYQVDKTCPFFTPIDYIYWATAYTDISITEQATQKRQEILKLGLSNLPNNPDLLFAYSLSINDNSSIINCLKNILEQEFSYESSFFDYATVYNNIAWHLCLSGKSLEALPYAEHSIRLNPSLDYSWETLGEIYYNLGRFNDCINAMRKCLNLNGDQQKSAYEFIGKSYQKLGEESKAKKNFELSKRFE